jgi:hypothetical protein
VFRPPLVRAEFQAAFPHFVRKELKNSRNRDVAIHSLKPERRFTAAHTGWRKRFFELVLDEL